MELASNEPNKPKLQLEYAGGGSGSNRKTAIGTQDGDAGGGPRLDLTELPNAPWWFRFVSRSPVKKYRKYFSEQSLPSANYNLKGAGVPPLYRLGLGLRWGFIVPDRDDFGVEDFALVMPFGGEVDRRLD